MLSSIALRAGGRPEGELPTSTRVSGRSQILRVLRIRPSLVLEGPSGTSLPTKKSSSQ